MSKLFNGIFLLSQNSNKYQKKLFGLESFSGQICQNVKTIKNVQNIKKGKRVKNYSQECREREKFISEQFKYFKKNLNN